MTYPGHSRATPYIGLVYLLIVAALVTLSVAAYRKDLPWQRGVTVTVLTPAAGLQLNPHSDVSLNGLRVGEVTAVDSDGRTATVTLRLDPAQARLIPAEVDASIVPTTLFGAKHVNLIAPAGRRGPPITDGTVIHQSSTAVEIGQLYTHLEAVLHTLRPDQLSVALGSLAHALQGRGRRIGDTAALLNTYLAGLTPHLPTLLHDVRQLGSTASTYADAAPALLATLDNTGAISNDLLIAHQQSLGRFLLSTTTASDQLRDLTARSGDGITTLTADARPILGLLARYSPEFPCLISTLNVANTAVDHVVGGEGPYLTATVDLFTQQPPYTYPNDLPSDPRSSAGNTKLPRGVPSWAPHCTTIPSQLRGLHDVGPYAAVAHGPGTTTPPSPSAAPPALPPSLPPSQVTPLLTPFTATGGGR
jgi:phospholipid/cholesterol/gamma-HCH transport system substrate-binding protein